MSIRLDLIIIIIMPIRLDLIIATLLLDLGFRSITGTFRDGLPEGQVFRKLILKITNVNSDLKKTMTLQGAHRAEEWWRDGR